MRTEQTTHEKRRHREGMDKYVFEPSRDIAAACGLIGFGVGMAIMSVAMQHPVMTPLGFVISVTCVFAGVGWVLSIRERLTAFYFDIMQDRQIDEKIITEHDTTKTVPRRIPNGKGEVIVELKESSGLEVVDWQKLASGVLVSRLKFSRKALAGVLSQPKYKKAYDYMIKNNYLNWDGNESQLTPDGEKFLNQYLPTEQPYSRLAGGGS